MNTFFDPARRWRELRAVAESMQSDVVRFRTRTGMFTVDRAEIRGPEQLFLRKIQSSRIAVVQLAGLTESSFARNYSSRVYRHGQNKASTADTFELRNLGDDAPIHMLESGFPDGRVIDNHHSPMCAHARLATYRR